VQIQFEKDCQLPAGRAPGRPAQQGRGEQDRPSEPGLQEGAGREAHQARGPAPQAQPSPGAAEGAAPGLPGHDPERDDAAQPGRRHLRGRPRARHRRASRTRREDAARERRGPGRGRPGSAPRPRRSASSTASSRKTAR
jgi:hypothetical protein